VQRADELTLAIDQHLAHRQVQGEHGPIAPQPLDDSAQANDLRVTCLRLLRQIAIVVVSVRRWHQHRDIAPDNV
jgi:hypothetical protein